MRLGPGRGVPLNRTPLSGDPGRLRPTMRPLPGGRLILGCGTASQAEGSAHLPRPDAHEEDERENAIATATDQARCVTLVAALGLP